MIPTMILFGLVFGRWWRLSLLVAALGWPTVLISTGVMGFEVGLLGAGGLALLNTAAGVLVHQGLLWSVRRLRHQPNMTAATRNSPTDGQLWT